MRTHPWPPPGLACVMQDLKLQSFNLQWFLDLGASFSSFGCSVFEFWMPRFRDLGASCFGLRFRVLRFRNYQPFKEAINGFVIKTSQSTSQLSWATFAASSNSHFRQKTKLSCSCCPHMEQNMASKEEGGAA